MFFAIYSFSNEQVEYKGISKLLTHKTACWNIRKHCWGEGVSIGQWSCEPSNQNKRLKKLKSWVITVGGQRLRQERKRKCTHPKIILCKSFCFCDPYNVSGTNEHFQTKSPYIIAIMDCSHRRQKWHTNYREKYDHWRELLCFGPFLN